MICFSVTGNILCKIWSFQIFGQKIGTNDFHAKQNKFLCRCYIKMEASSSIAFNKLTIWYSLSCSLALAISQVLIGWHLIFCAVTRLQNVRRLNIRRGKRLGFQLWHRQPHMLKYFQIRKAYWEKWSSKLVNFLVSVTPKFRSNISKNNV